MPLEQLLQYVPAYVLTAFRVAGLMLLMPLFGSSRIPKRVKVMFALVVAMGMVAGVQKPVAMPGSLWELSAAIAGELTFGLAMGIAMSLVFIAAQWAGELVGQQIGFNISEVLDPQYGQAGSLMGDLFFMFTLAIFLIVGGHHAMLQGVHESLQVAPLLSLGMGEGLLDSLLQLLSGASVLAFRLAAPMFVTMLVVDVAIGCISKTMPQFNVMTAGLSLRAIVGVIVVISSAFIFSEVLGASVLDAMRQTRLLWTTPSP
jgi:flagellar biosynthetic protein FliR